MLSFIRRGGRLSSPYRLSSIAPRPAWNLAATRTMSVYHGESTLRPEPDKVLRDIADYVHNYQVTSSLAFETARLCLIDTIGCGLEGLRFEGCSRLLGPVVEGTLVPNGAPHVLLRQHTSTSDSAMQERKSPAPTTSWTLSEVPSTSAR